MRIPQPLAGEGLRRFKYMTSHHPSPSCPMSNSFPLNTHSVTQSILLWIAECQPNGVTSSDAAPTATPDC